MLQYVFYKADAFCKDKHKNHLKMQINYNWEVCKKNEATMKKLCKKYLSGYDFIPVESSVKHNAKDHWRKE